MKVKDLKKFLEATDDDVEVLIRVRPPGTERIAAQAVDDHAVGSIEIIGGDHE